MVRGKQMQKGSRKAAVQELPSDLEDEVEKFHKRKNTLSLNASDDELDEDSLDDEEVYGISDADEDEDDSDLDSDEDEGKLGRLTKQAKALGAKLRIAQGEGEEGESEDEDEEDTKRREKVWGKKKGAYYDADNIDLEGSDEEEALREEEEEAVRLQREAAEQLLPEDYGAEEGGEGSDDQAGSSSEEEEEEEGEGTLGAMAAKVGVAVEHVGKDISALSAEERTAAVLRDAPELLVMLNDLRGSLAEVRSRVGPLLKEVREGSLATAEGVSYLEAKHLLLLHYCASIVFYLLLKAEGRAVKDHPVIQRMVEIRAYLEKVRPIDKKLHYQMEKLLAAAQAAAAAGGGEAAAAAAKEGGAGGSDDPLRYGPRPDALVPKVQQDAEGAEGGAGVYRPPKLNPVSMEDVDVEEGRKFARERRREAQAARKASRSELVQELARELAGAPEEQRAAIAGLDTAEAIRARNRMQSRDAVEEELMIRLPLGKEERKRLKAQRREGLAGRALLDDFGDDIADLVDGAAGDVGGGFGRHRLSQKFGVDLAAAAAKKAVRSGDADLPGREPLHERRAKFDSVRAKHGLQAGPYQDGGDDGMGGGGGGKRSREPAGGEEDEFYRQVKTTTAGKKAKRQEAYSFPETLPPAADPTTTEARAITRDIEKNRGLTPHRKKDLKNPRKKNRIKFAQASVRRKGQVQAVRSGEAGGYGGEQTGIKSRVSKSVKF